MTIRTGTTGRPATTSCTSSTQSLIVTLLIGFGGGRHPMPPEVHGQCLVALVGEEVPEVIVPASCPVVRAVNEKHWYWVRFAGRSLSDHLEHGRPTRDIGRARLIILPPSSLCSDAPEVVESATHRSRPELRSTLYV